MHRYAHVTHTRICFPKRLRLRLPVRMCVLFEHMYVFPFICACAYVPLYTHYTCRSLRLRVHVVCVRVLDPVRECIDP
jgi:hypothetical protein